MSFSGMRNRILFFCRAHWFLVFVILIYTFFSAYYMGPGFTNCSNSIYGFGDSTAGPIWRNSLKPEQPLFGGPETKTNYPYGESLYSPVNYVATVQTVTMGALSKVVTPVCAYNIYNIIGYLTTGVVTYLFVVYLTRKKWIALLAGYAVAFTPYVQSKIGGHPNYAFAGLMVGVIWSLVHLIRTKSVKTAIVLAVLLATCAYLDPYFTLLAITAVPPVLFVWLAMIWLHGRGGTESQPRAGLRGYIKPFGIGILIFVALLAPIAIIRVEDAAKINTTVSKARGNIMAAAMLCSNKPLDYIIPDPTNVYLKDLLGPNYTNNNISHRDWCGYAESRVSLSITLMVVIAAAMVTYLVRDRRRLRAIFTSRDFVRSGEFVVLCLIAVGITAVLVGLPPRLHGMIMPSGVILKITTMWRIFAREYLLVNISLVLAAAMGLAYLGRVMASATRRGLWAKGALLALVFVGVMAEYQINPPFGPLVFDYATDVPKVYKDIKNNGDIKVIAEYPMDRMGIEYDSVSYYMTMQGVYEKSMVNSVLSTDSRESTHYALKDLSDPQTIPALRYMGVDHVVVHGESVGEVLARTGDNLKLVDSSDPAIFGLKMFRPEATNEILLFKINPGTTDSNILTIESGAVIDLPLIQSPTDTRFELLNNAVLRETQLGSQKVTNSLVCFDARMSDSADSGILYIYKGDKVTKAVHLSGVYTRVSLHLSSGDEIRLNNVAGYNMRINNLNGECGE